MKREAGHKSFGRKPQSSHCGEPAPHSRQGRGQPQATNLSLRGLNCLLLLGQKEARLLAGEKISPIKCLYA